ncbi:unnamed protein product [Linum tenue]|uniref:Bromo domain-containing protein n=1 Tax=Linum tenue TaxID=586396 RepID=A0AAV0RSI4_9ROSI|nr:unnamed protein product [Linum tenue]
MSKVEARGKRRSARIVALEEKARALSLQRAESKTLSDSGSASCNASSSSTAAAATKNRKRGRKRKSLHDVHLGASAFPQEQEMPEYDGMSIKHGGRFFEANWPSNQLMPNKGALEFILDVLQRRDVQELFAEPVNPTEVTGYYDVVKEPMDFGTMRAKLQEDMYTSLEQFEHDVFLVFSNAMRFNVSNSVYYEAAKDLSILGQRLFHSLKTEPRNFDYIYTRTRQQMSNKAQGEAGGPLAKLMKSGGARGGISLNDSNRTDQKYLAPWHSKRHTNQSTGKVSAGSREGSSFLSPETERRSTYISQITWLNKEKPIVSAVYNSPKSLTDASDAGMRYRESLNKFVEDLGPKVKAVADRKLGKQPVEALSSMSWNPTFSSQPTNLLEPAAGYSLFGRTASENLVRDGQIRRSFTANSSNSFKGKMICMDASGMSSHNVLGRRQQPISGYRSDSSAVGKLPFGHSSYGGDSFSNRNLDISGTSEEKTTARIGNMDLLLATIVQVSAMQRRNSRCPSGSYFPLTGNGPPSSGSLFPCWGNGGPLGFQPSQMLLPLTSNSSKPAVSSNGAGKSQFTTFLRGVEPRHHQTVEGTSKAGSVLDQRLKGKTVYPVDFSQLLSWTTQGATSQGPNIKSVAVPPRGDQLKASPSREKELFQTTSMFDGANRDSSQQAKPRWMAYDGGSSSSTAAAAAAAPPSFKIGHQQPDLSLQL